MQKTLGNLIVTVYVIGAFALIAYVVFFAFVHHTEISKDPGDWGTLGDYFGGLLNPVVSFATLVVAYAVWKQQKEELKATKEALEEQAKTVEQQRREQRFFDLMNVYFKTVDSISSNFIRDIRRPKSNRYGLSSYETVGTELIRTEGKAALAHELSLIEERGADDIDSDTPSWQGLLQRSTSQTEPNPSAVAGHLRSEWKEAQDLCDMSHFFRVTRLILSDAQHLLGDDHTRYVGLFISQLSNSELTLMAYHLWLDEEGAASIPNAKQYGLLRNLSHHRGIFMKHLPADCFVHPQ
jgi:uncharacterized membrane protein